MTLWRTHEALEIKPKFVGSCETHLRLLKRPLDALAIILFPDCAGPVLAKAQYVEGWEPVSGDPAYVFASSTL